MTSPVCDVSINENCGSSHHHRKLKPGTKKSVNNEQEKIRNEIQALRMQKSRLIKNLRKIVRKFQNQTYEPVETLFIIYEKNKNIFKYFGSGDIVEKFQSGEALMKDPKRRSKMSAYIEPRALTPGKYKFPFTCGSGENLAAAQEKELLNLPVSLKDSRVLSVNIKSRSNQGEQGNDSNISTNFKKSKKSLFPTRAKRLSVRGRGRGRREKKTREIQTDYEVLNELMMESSSERVDDNEECNTTDECSGASNTVCGLNDVDSSQEHGPETQHLLNVEGEQLAPLWKDGEFLKCVFRGKKRDQFYAAQVITVVDEEPFVSFFENTSSPTKKKRKVIDETALLQHNNFVKKLNAPKEVLKGRTTLFYFEDFN